MSKYTVSYGYCREQTVGLDTWADVIARVKELGSDDYSVIGENYDCDYDECGYRCITDGLTDNERDELQEINEQ